MSKLDELLGESSFAVQSAPTLKSLHQIVLDDDVELEEGMRGGPGGQKCSSCGWQGSCDELDDGKCPECGEEVTQVGQGNPPATESTLDRLLGDPVLEGEFKLKISPRWSEEITDELDEAGIKYTLDTPSYVLHYPSNRTHVVSKIVNKKRS